jgi:hypothetical protein
MRRITVLEHITLDGVIQAGGGPDEDTSNGFAYGGWCAPFDDDVIGAEVKKMLDMPIDLLLGCKTFDIGRRFGRNMATFGPTSTRPLNTSPRTP